MKKIILLVAVIFLVGCVQLNAKNEDTLKVKIGFFLVPQGIIDFQKIETGLYSANPVFAVCSFIKDKSLINVMYNMTINNIQVVYTYQISKVCGVYLAINKSILTTDGYSGIAVTRSVMSGNANAFFEFGSGWNSWNPTIHTGVIIPLMFQIK